MSLFDKINNSFVRITKDGSSQSINTATNGTTLVKSITIGNNSNRILIVSTGEYSAGVVSGVTLGSQNFVRAISASHSTHGFITEIWYLINPTVGTADITVTWSGTAGRRGITGTSFYNVDQSQLLQNNVTNTVDSGGQSSTVSGTITPTTTGSMVIDAMMWLNGTQASLTRTAGAIQFIGGNDRSTGQQYMLTPTIGSANTMNYTASDSARWIWVGVEVKPVSTPHQPNQRVVENFSGSVLDTDRWNVTTTGNGTATMEDDGLKLTSDSGATGGTMINFNNIRQYSQTGSVCINVCKRTSTSNAQMLSGFTDTTGLASDYVAIKDYTSNTYKQLSTANNGTATHANSSVAIDASYHTHKIECLSSSVVLYIDGVSEVTNTTNLPNVKMQPFFYAGETAGVASAKSAHIRYMEAYNT